MAKAQTLAWLLAEKADFGMSPPMVASPTRWIPGCSFDSNVVGSTGHQPDWSARPACCASSPAICGGMTLATAALKVSACGHHRQVLHVDRLDPAGELAGQPLDHARIVAGPGVLEQVLLEEAVLRIEDQDLRLRLELLEIVGDQRRALVGAGRAAERVRAGRRSRKRRRPPCFRAAGAAARSAARHSRHAA